VTAVSPGVEPGLVLGAGQWSVTERRGRLTAAERLAADVRAGLRQHPPTLPARWFYDERGSRLFEQITELPEYYPTRRETEILTSRAAEIATLTTATTLVELGSGTSAKTRLLLDALTASQPITFAPIDVSAEVLTTAARAVAAEYPTVVVRAVVGDFDDPLGPLPGTPGRRLVAFLGGTIGNLEAAGRAAFFGRLRAAMAAGDHFLLGADLKKDPRRLVAAYDDSAGVTAEFNRNLIEVLRRELAAVGLSAADFEHVARWNDEAGRIEMWLRAVRAVHARFPSIDLDWDLAAGEEMLTEISVKFDLPALHAELAASGFVPTRAWTDEAADFSLSLLAAR
jgi:L-histidine N-alpha-methyltransferase